MRAWSGEDMRAFGKAFAQTRGCSGADVLSCMRALKLADVMDAYTKWICPKGAPRAASVACAHPPRHARHTHSA
jgi:hypothetical protein